MTTAGTYYSEMPECTHSWVKNDDKSTAATCTDGGTDFFDCSLCGETKTEPTSATGHAYGAWVDKTAATCTADKIQEKTCSKCGNKQTQTVTGTKLGHSYGTPVWEWSEDFSTATAKFTCSRGCGDTRNLYATVSQTPTAATCLAKGKITYTATLAVVGTEFSQSTYTDTREKETDKLNHVAATTWSKDATSHWHECTRGCGTQLDKVAHTLDIWKVDTPATVTSTGVGHYECVCGERGTDVEIPKDICPHTNKTHVAAVAATCITAGNPEYWHCDDCNKNLDGSNSEISTVVTPTDANNHVSWGDWQPVTAATCTEKGSEKRVCADCGHEETRETAIDPTAHDLVHHGGQAATCTEAGWDEYDTCTRCDYTTYSEIAASGHTAGAAATCTQPQTCTECGTELAPALGHSYEWQITKPATTEEDGLMENLCSVCGDKDGEEEIAKLEDPDGNGEIDLPVDINVEFKVTQSSTDNDYADIDKGLKRGYWAQLWYRNKDGTLGDEYTETMNCFLTLKIPTEIIEAIRGGAEINRDKIAEGLSVYYIDGEGVPVGIEKFEIAMRDDDSWQIKFNYNAKFRAEVVFAADVPEQPAAKEPDAGIPWWVWLLVVIGCATVLGVVIVIIVVAKKKNGNGTTVIEGAQYDDAHIRAHLSEQDRKLDEIKEIVDGGFNDTMDE